uniref:Uncharacterized protein n=1 Tax=Anguilla anguilla TaxID=7936 RepID=A0A0E9QTZ8_ANGAN
MFVLGFTFTNTNNRNFHLRPAVFEHYQLF